MSQKLEHVSPVIEVHVQFVGESLKKSVPIHFFKPIDAYGKTTPQIVRATLKNLSGILRKDLEAQIYITAMTILELLQNLHEYDINLQPQKKGFFYRS